MDETKSRWQTAELSKTFLRDIRGAIPGADLQLAVISRITRQWCRDPVRILDLGCGDGILGKMLLTIFPSAACLFMDFSEPMLAAARKNVGPLGNAAFARADFSIPKWRRAAEFWTPFDLVISGFAIHHQPDDRKRALYKEIHEVLTAGGVFLSLEHIASATAAGQRLFDAFFIDHLCAFHGGSGSGTDREAIADAYYNRPDKQENILSPVTDQCRWLEEIGFADVDCFFKVFELAIFGGRKKARPG